MWKKLIKSVVPLIKNIDGLKIIQNKKLNIYFQLNAPNKNINKNIQKLWTKIFFVKTQN